MTGGSASPPPDLTAAAPGLGAGAEGGSCPRPTGHGPDSGPHRAAATLVLAGGNLGTPPSPGSTRVTYTPPEPGESPAGGCPVSFPRMTGGPGLPLPCEEAHLGPRGWQATRAWGMVTDSQWDRDSGRAGSCRPVHSWPRPWGQARVSDPRPGHSHILDNRGQGPHGIEAGSTRPWAASHGPLNPRMSPSHPRSRGAWLTAQ